MTTALVCVGAILLMHFVPVLAVPVGITLIVLAAIVLVSGS